MSCSQPVCSAGAPLTAISAEFMLLVKGERSFCLFSLEIQAVVRAPTWVPGFLSGDKIARVMLQKSTVAFDLTRHWKIPSLFGDGEVGAGLRGPCEDCCA